MSHRHPLRTGVVAALLAMLLFAFAGIKSDLMQVAMLAPAAHPAAMTAMDGMPTMTAPAAHGAHHGAAGQSDCPYCDVAAHLSLHATSLAVPAPWTALWTPRSPMRLFSPRGPPLFTLNARGPPAFLIA